MRGSKAPDFDASNMVAATAILSDPEGYGGDDALAVVWAQRVIRRLVRKPKQGDLFETSEVLNVSYR